MPAAVSQSDALDSDTIVAVTTASGRGGVGIVRLSGPDASRIGTLIAGELPPPREAVFATFRDAKGAPIDNGLALCFHAPASFTGEDVVELQGHGSPVTLQMLVKVAVAAGARPARAGEFSERAYMNGKLDLAQAEAVADLINADSEAMAQAAMRSLRGEFSKLVHDMMAALTALRVHVEAAIDFPDEDIELHNEPRISFALTGLLEEVAHLRKRAREGVLLNEGVRLVLLGAPNVGKSSVLNRLCGAERAIVTEVPGTTRDLLRERIHLAGMPVELVDTAGLRASQDVIEQEGIRRAEAAALDADLIIAVFDASDANSRSFISSKLDELQSNDRSGSEKQTERQIEKRIKTLIVANKSDLIDRPNVWSEPEENTYSPEPVSPVHEAPLLVSAKLNEGFDELTERLVSALEVSGDQARGVFSARTRHLLALAAAGDFLADAQRGIEQEIGAELVAEYLRLAQNELGGICGELTSDALLGEIFSSFCIGK